MLEGCRARTAGDVEVLGRDPGHPTREWRSRLGIVAQGSGDLAELTVLETVRHFSGFYPRGRRAEEVIEQVGLADDARTRARALSGGRRRRLDVALGIVGDPELLFLDEPTTGFDPAARRSFWALVQDLAADGTTIVLTTHYLDEVEVLADRLAVLAGGRVVATGTPADLAGRDRAPATVSWRDADGHQRSETTQTPTALVASLTAHLAPAASTAATTARSNLAEARAIVEALRPVDLSAVDLPAGERPGGAADQDADDSPLLGALHRLGRRFSAETGAQLNLTGATELPPLPLRLEVVLLRAAQEGLSNVRQHARAGHVQVEVDVDDSEVLLRVVDDGRGPRPNTGNGYGLEAMTSRLREVGGRAVLEPGEGGGSTLTVRVPLPGQVRS